MSETSPFLLTAIAEDVTTLTLNRPAKRNALNVELLENLGAAIDAADANPSQRFLVLRGAGSIFCSGMDLEEATRPERMERSAAGIERALQALATTRLITLAAVQGAAVAGGAGLMAACDFVVATHEAKFGFPEVRRGLVPALIMTFLRRQLRERDARELLLLGQLCDADHAQHVGLVNRVVPSEVELDAQLAQWISNLRQGGPETLARTKQLLTEMWPASLHDDFRRAAAVHVAARTSNEATEGFAAFVGKRPPSWATGTAPKQRND
jgi:methylglutaconyl-CoA hydratase